MRRRRRYATLHRYLLSCQPPRCLRHIHYAAYAITPCLRYYAITLRDIAAIRCYAIFLLHYCHDYFTYAICQLRCYAAIALFITPYLFSDAAAADIIFASTPPLVWLCHIDATPLRQPRCHEGVIVTPVIVTYYYLLNSFHTDVMPLPPILPRRHFEHAIT